MNALIRQTISNFEKGSKGAHLRIIKKRKLVQLDIGFKNNLPNFVKGEGSIKKTPLEEPLTQLCEQFGPIRLVGAIGAGDLAPCKEWLDLTASASSDKAVLEFQSVSSHRILAKYRMNFPNEPFYGDEKPKVSFLFSTNIYPIMQGIFSTESENKNWSDSLYLGHVESDVDLRDAIGSIPDVLDKSFVFVNGAFDDVTFRPLKSIGPKENRGFRAADEPDSDVVWIRGKTFVGLMVASFDPSSYTPLHMHTIDTDIEKFSPGGHIENAIVKKGSEIMVIRANQIISSD